MTEIQEATKDQVREALSECGDRFDVDLAYPYPLLPGYMSKTQEEVLGQECRSPRNDKLIGVVITLDTNFKYSQPIHKRHGCWWLEIIDFEEFMACEGQLFNFPGIERDMDEAKRIWAESMGSSRLDHNLQQGGE